MRVSIILIGLILIGVVAVVVDSEENPHEKLSWDCADCHSTESWNRLAKEMKFNHSETGFRLDGGHQGVSCRSCHAELVFSHVGTACADCHADHHLGQLGTDCQNCHTTRDWRPETDVLLKHAERGFPLTGVHAVADCDACHRTQDRQEFSGTSVECEDCHRNDLALVTDPDHSALAFSTDCQQCHRAAFGSWGQTTYNHPGSFPLLGAHAAAECSACHSKSFVGTPTDCYSCHADEYLATSDPDHLQAGFSHDCNECHSFNGWTPATFDHNQTAFPLTGRHVTAACVSCHETSYAGTATNCYACHQTDYDGTTDPSHASANFPVTCEDCHSTSGWSPASWDHDAQYFPIYSGAHNGRWSDCTECHTVPGDFLAFDCTACHAHNQTDMDAHHSSVLDYQYLSSACYECHPRGVH